MCALVLTGPDRVRYLNGQVTNDVSTLADGQAFYAAVCTAKGRMEGDFHIAAHGAELYLDTSTELNEASVRGSKNISLPTMRFLRTSVTCGA